MGKVGDIGKGQGMDLIGGCTSSICRLHDGLNESINKKVQPVSSSSRVNSDVFTNVTH